MSLLRDRNLHVVFAISLVAVLGVASLAPAFPTIARALEVTPEQVGWLVTVFTLPGVVLTPVMGVVADRWGRKRVLAPSLFLFALAGGACALAPDFQTLLALRFVQGVGSAALGSLNVTLVGDIFQGSDRGRAMGYNASIISVGTASWPLLGGLLAQWHWRAPFVLPLLGIGVGFAVLFALRNPEPGEPTPLRGYVAGVGRNLADRRVVGLFLVSTLTFVLLYGAVLTYFPILLDRRFGVPSSRIGLVIAVFSVSSGLTSTQVGRLGRRFGEARLIQVAFGVFAVALYAVTLVHQLGWIFVPVVLWGVGMGLCIPSMQTLLATLAPMEQRGAFLSLNGMVLRLGQTLGPVIMGIVYGAAGLDAPFVVGTGIALGAAVLVLLTLGSTRAVSRR